jgi:hypothetical protein
MSRVIDAGLVDVMIANMLLLLFLFDRIQRTERRRKRLAFALQCVYGELLDIPIESSPSVHILPPRSLFLDVCPTFCIPFPMFALRRDPYKFKSMCSSSLEKSE